MAKNIIKKKISFDKCLKNIKKAAEYKEYIKEIKEKYNLEEKELFIKEVQSYIKEDFFLNDFARRISSYINASIDASLSLDLEAIFEKYGGEVDIFECKGCYYGEYKNDRIYIYTEYGNLDTFSTEKTNIVDFPMDLDIISFIQELDKFYAICSDKIIEKRNREKKEEEQREYRLYLKLKEKYEKD